MRPGCIPALMASTCVAVNGTAFLLQQEWNQFKLFALKRSSRSVGKRLQSLKLVLKKRRKGLQNFIKRKRFLSSSRITGPLHDPVTQWEFQNRRTRTSPARLSFVLKVPLSDLRPSIIYSVPCDRIVQRDYSLCLHKGIHDSESV